MKRQVESQTSEKAGGKLNSLVLTTVMKRQVEVRWPGADHSDEKVGGKSNGLVLTIDDKKVGRKSNGLVLTILGQLVVDKITEGIVDRIVDRPC